MKIHITDLGVQGGNLGVCVYDCGRKRIPVGNSWNKKRILVTVYRGVWMNECSMMLAGPGSAFGGTSSGGGGRDDNCPTTDYVKRCQIVRRDCRDDQPRSLVIDVTLQVRS